MKRQTEHQIDQLLLRQGEYHPLEFLLQEGRLSYSDYEAWRNGEVSELSELLFGDPEQILSMLQHAASYLQARGWEERQLDYPRRGRGDARPLCFSQNRQLNRCFHNGYRKPQEQPQLDLFCDTSTTYHVNGITEALKSLDEQRARESLHRLYETAPDHSQLGELERLVEALENLRTPVDDAALEIARLRTETTGLAERLLGPQARELLIPLWRRLSNGLWDHPFDPAHPELHLSYTATASLDWPTVRQAVDRENHWHRQATLLERRAHACTQLHEQAAMIESWCLLCWQFPDKGSHLTTSDDHRLNQLWLDFLDLEPELPVESFPAWLLMRLPGALHLAPTDHAPAPCPDSYRTLYRLKQHHIESRTNATDEHTIALRAQLKQQDPLLFRHLLAQS